MSRRMPKPFAILIAALLALYVVPFNALPAMANASGNTTFGGFEMDGNFYEGTDNSTTAVGPTGDPVDWGSADIKSQVDVVEDPLESSDPTVYANGSHEDTLSDWSDEASAQAPGKGDLGNLYVYDRLFDVDPGAGVTNNQFLYLAFERESSSGSVTYFIELNQKANTTNGNNAVVPDRSAGDLRVAVTQGGNGSFSISSVKKWNGSSFTDVTLPAGSFELRVNDSTISMGDLPKWTSVSRPAKYFVEAGFNLSALDVDLDCPSTGFSSAFVRSQSSKENANPELKDYTTGPINVPSNCSQFKIEKRKGTLGGALLPGAKFAITPNPFPGQTSPDPVIVTDGGAGDADGTANGTVLINPAKAGTYSVSEDTAPLGYIKESGSKPVTAQAYAQDPVVLVFTNDHGKAEWEKIDSSSLEKVCCATFRVQGTGGAAQTLGYDVTVEDDNDNNTVTEGSTTADDLNDAAGIIRLGDLPTGTYTVTETVPPAGYELDSPSVKTFTVSSTTLDTSLTGKASNTGTAGAFRDKRLTPDVSIQKHDTTNGGAVVVGDPQRATFALYADTGVVGTYEPGIDTLVTGHGTNPQAVDNSGTAMWTNLDWAHYVVVETVAPTGYNLPANPYTFFEVKRENAGTDQALHAADPRKPSTVTVTKKDKQGNVITTSPAKFGLYVDSNDDGIHQDGEPQVVGTPQLNPQWTTTDGTAGATVDGTASWSNLGFGHYVVHELQAPQGYALPTNPDVQVDIDAANAGGSFSVSMQDPKLKTPLTVKKTDSAGRPLAGATFQLWQETNGTDDLQTYDVTGQVDPTKDTYLGDCVTVLPDGTCTLPEGSDAFEITWPNTYYWAETAPPAGYSLPAPDDRVKTVTVTQANITDPFPPTVFTDPKPDIETHATASDLPQGTITDYADLTGVPSDATGTLHFTLYGPFADASLKGDSCVNPNLVVKSQDVAVTGPGHYPTGGVVSGTATKPGTYYWYVTFTSPDDLFGAAVEPCGSPNEVVTVDKATPVITTQATPSATYLDAQHGTIQDIVKVRPVSADATGNLTVSVWGPSQSATPDCTGTPARSWTATRTQANAALKYSVTLVSGKYEIGWTTPAFAAPGAGYYFWKASYAGDSNNAGADHACGEVSATLHEVSHVDKAPVTVTTSATPSSLISPAGTDPVNDQIFVTYDGVRPTGTVTVNLYGPLAGGAQSCATSPSAHAAWALDLDKGSVITDPSGTYVALATPDFTPTAAGTYRWAASYSGDKNYLAEAAACPDPLEVTTVSKPELDKFADPATVATTADGTPTLVPRDSVIEYTLTVTNTGDAAISNKPLVDTLPDQVVFQGVTGSTPLPTAGLDLSGHATLTWSVSLAPGASQTFTYTVKVKTAAPSGELLVNTARFLGLEDTTTHQVGVPVPGLDKSSPNEGATVPLGSTIHYKVTVANTGNFPISGSPVVDTLPVGVTYVGGSASSAATGGGSASATPTTGTSGGHATLTWTVTLPPSATATFEFDVTVNGDNPRGAELRNTAAFENLTDFTVHYVGIPGPTLDKFSNPATTDSSPTVVQPGSRIHYSVKVGNTGNFPITNAPVVDTLPSNVTVDAGTISDGGSLSADGKSITWTVTLAPGESKTLTYSVTVSAAAPQGTLLVNTATFQNLSDTTTHVVPTGALTLVKAVSPRAGNGVLVEFGDKLTYTLTASATGNLDQTNVVVTDYLPGRDPARPGSGDTTYVAGTATCIGAGTCTVTGPDANGLITWRLGDMAAGSSRQITFQVTIDDVTGRAGETVAVDILNAGAVRSDRTPSTPSNVVRTPVSKVLPVKIPRELPHTGATLPLGPVTGGGVLLLGLGLLLAAAGRRRTTGAHRR